MRIYAVDASTGTKIWGIKVPNLNILSSPAVANGVVYVGGVEGTKFAALNPATGARLWTLLIGDPGIPSGAVADGVLYLSSTDHHVYALGL
jgi:outer membrane protein assembly factor BamB